MIKTLLLLNFCFISVVAMEQLLNIAEIHTKIDQDGEAIYAFLETNFKKVATVSGSTLPPSAILTCLMGVNNTQLQYMSAPQYLNEIMRNHFEEFDAAFASKSEEGKNAQKTWEWFIAYFYHRGIIAPFNQFKNKFIKNSTSKYKQCTEFKRLGYRNFAPLK